MYTRTKSTPEESSTAYPVPVGRQTQKNQEDNAVLVAVPLSTAADLSSKSTKSSSSNRVKTNSTQAEGDFVAVQRIVSHDSGIIASFQAQETSPSTISKDSIIPDTKPSLYLKTGKQEEEIPLEFFSCSERSISDSKLDCRTEKHALPFFVGNKSRVMSSDVHGPDDLIDINCPDAGENSSAKGDCPLYKSMDTATKQSQDQISSYEKVSYRIQAVQTDPLDIVGMNNMTECQTNSPDDQGSTLDNPESQREYTDAKLKSESSAESSRNLVSEACLSEKDDSYSKDDVTPNTHGVMEPDESSSGTIVISSDLDDGVFYVFDGSDWKETTYLEGTIENGLDSFIIMKNSHDTDVDETDDEIQQRESVNGNGSLANTTGDKTDEEDEGQKNYDDAGDSVTYNLLKQSTEMDKASVDVSYSEHYEEDTSNGDTVDHDDCQRDWHGSIPSKNCYQEHIDTSLKPECDVSKGDPRQGKEQTALEDTENAVTNSSENLLDSGHASFNLWLELDALLGCGPDYSHCEEYLTEDWASDGLDRYLLGNRSTDWIADDLWNFTSVNPRDILDVVNYSEREEGLITENFDTVEIPKSAEAVLILSDSDSSSCSESCSFFDSSTETCSEGESCFSELSPVKVKDVTLSSAQALPFYAREKESCEYRLPQNHDSLLRSQELLSNFQRKFPEVLSSGWPCCKDRNCPSRTLSRDMTQNWNINTLFETDARFPNLDIEENVCFDHSFFNSEIYNQLQRQSPRNEQFAGFVDHLQQPVFKQIYSRRHSSSGSTGQRSLKTVMPHTRSSAFTSSPVFYQRPIKSCLRRLFSPEKSLTSTENNDDKHCSEADDLADTSVEKTVDYFLKLKSPLKSKSSGELSETNNDHSEEETLINDRFYPIH